MDVKKTKRRKSVGGKRHSLMEENPKSAEVMNEKEKQDRLEAASVLSSLMFFPPPAKTDADEDEDDSKKDLDTPTSKSPRVVSLKSLPGFPISLNVTPQLPKLGRPPKPGSRISVATERSKAILAELESGLKHSRDNILFSIGSRSQTQTQIVQDQLSKTSLPSSHLPLTLSNSKLATRHVSPALVSQTLTVNQDVAKALRNAMSKNAVVKTEADAGKDSEGRSKSPSVQSADTKEGESSVSSATSKKKDSSDTNLPLKKRRLVGMDSSSKDDENASLETASFHNLATLATARQIHNIIQMEHEHLNTKTSQESDHVHMQAEGYKPVEVDPRTSLMVLSDLKFALTPDSDGDLPLHIAVVHEDLELVRKYVDIMMMSGKTVDRFNKLQQTPLHLAVIVNKPAIVECLLVADADPNLLDRYGCTCVHSSVSKQFNECMNVLLDCSKSEINLNTRDYEGYFPLHTCVELDNLEMLKELVQRGAEVNSQDGKAGRSVLMYAVEYNRCKMVEYLLDHGANAELQNYASVTPLMIAQAGKMDEMLNLLNKALDIVKIEDQQYVPAKKMAIARTFSRSDLSERRPSLTMNGIPLFYEEYPYPGPSSSSQENKPVFSRQSSTSSPIDLSMRGSIDHSPAPFVESARSRQARKKGKKEKNNKEKPVEKSDLKEKHSSILAALESKPSAMNSTAGVIQKVGDLRRTDTENQSKDFQSLMSANLQLLLGKFGFQHLLQSFLSMNQGRPVGLQNADLQNVQNKDNIDADTNSGQTDNDTDKANFANDSETENMDMEEKSPSLDVQRSSSPIHKDIDSGVGVIDEVSPGESQDNPIPDSTNGDNAASENTDEAVSPTMPVLSRATSECHDIEEPHDASTSTLSVNDSVSNSPLPDISMQMFDHCKSAEESEHPSDVKLDSDVNTDCINNDVTPNCGNEMESGKNDLNKEELSTDSGEKTVTEKSELDNAPVTERTSSEESVAMKTETPIVPSKPLSRDARNAFQNKSEFVEKGDKVKKVDLDESDHSDDSMEYELTDISSNKMPDKIGSVKNKATIDVENAGSKCSDSVQNWMDDNTLVMDLDDDQETELVIDENVTDNSPEVDHNSRSERIGDAMEVDENEKKEGTEERGSRNMEMVVTDCVASMQQVYSDGDQHGNVVGSLSESTEINKKARHEEGIDNDKEQKTDEENKLSNEKLTVKSSETLVKPGSSEPAVLVDNLLKTGQSRLLYYYDGSNYKPVRIFIDNSEQSSKVLNQMIQSAQFSTLDSSYVSTKLATNNPVSQTVQSKPPVPTKNIVTTQISQKLPESSEQTKDKHKTIEEVPKIKNKTKSKPPKSQTVVSESDKSSSYQSAFIKSLKSSTDSETVTSTPKTGKRKSPSAKKADPEHTESHSEIKHKRIVDESDDNKSSSSSSSKTSNVDTVSGSVSSGTNVLTKKVSANHLPIKTLCNEGTLTRVNPDIKSRLSKALQSAQRKTGPDSVPYSNGGHNFDVNNCIPVEVISTITAGSDTRQQL